MAVDGAQNWFTEIQPGTCRDPPVCWDCRAVCRLLRQTNSRTSIVWCSLGNLLTGPWKLWIYLKGSISTNCSMKPLLLYCSLAKRRITPSLIWSRYYCLTEKCTYLHLSYYLNDQATGAYLPRPPEHYLKSMCRRFLFCRCLSCSEVDSAVPAPKIRPPAGIASPSWSSFS